LLLLLLKYYNYACIKKICIKNFDRLNLAFTYVNNNSLKLVHALKTTPLQP
jgi:hypothetical protein